MLLRRFSKHVKDQNWFAVGIDVLVVIVGIYLGLQVTDWAEERNNRDLELKYIERLIGDVEISIATQEKTLGFYTIVPDAYAETIELLLAKAPAPEDRTNLKYTFAFLGGYPRPILDMTTINELESSGRMLLISNLAIRRELSELKENYRVANDMMINIQRINVPLIAHLAKYSYDHENARYFYDNYGADGIVDFANIKTRVDYERLLEDPDAAAYLSTISAKVLVVMRKCRENLANLAAIKELLVAERDLLMSH